MALLGRSQRAVWPNHLRRLCVDTRSYRYRRTSATAVNVWRLSKVPLDKEGSRRAGLSEQLQYRAPEFRSWNSFHALEAGISGIGPRLSGIEPGSTRIGISGSPFNGRGAGRLALVRVPRSADRHTSQDCCPGFRKMTVSRQGPGSRGPGRHERRQGPGASLISGNDGNAWNKDAWKHPIKAAASASELPAATICYSIRHGVMT